MLELRRWSWLHARLVFPSDRSSTRGYITEPPQEAREVPEVARSSDLRTLARLGSYRFGLSAWHHSTILRFYDATENRSYFEHKFTIQSLRCFTGTFRKSALSANCTSNANVHNIKSVVARM